LLAGGLRQIADYLSFNLVGITRIANSEKYQYSFLPFYCGSMLAIFGGGIFHDTLFYGKSQFFIAILNVLSIAWNTMFLFIDEREDAYNETLLFGLGFATAFSEFFLSFLIPL